MRPCGGEILSPVAPCSVPAAGSAILWGNGNSRWESDAVCYIFLQEIANSIHSMSYLSVRLCKSVHFLLWWNLVITAPVSLMTFPVFTSNTLAFFFPSTCNWLHYSFLTLNLFVCVIKQICSHISIVIGLSYLFTACSYKIIQVISE